MYGKLFSGHKCTQLLYQISNWCYRLMVSSKKLCAGKIVSYNHTLTLHLPPPQDIADTHTHTHTHIHTHTHDT